MAAHKVDSQDLRKGDDVMLNQVEVAAILGISPRTVKKYRLHGDLPYYRIGGLVKFRMKEVAEWIKAHQAQ